ncbi:amidohydrolase family protein, partial [Desulfovibrio sp. OttesenSCG-928-O18]|nr:amidohydrolase family protein [Desulfovibrio sp. OttesenSCG-928-O18]
MKYDFIIKNGTVIDPGTGFVGKRDIYVKDGVVAKGDANAECPRIIDAEGCYVTPGLIDSHTHTYHGGNAMAGRPDIIFPPSCVTTALDAGSAGIGNMEGFYRDRLVWATTVKAAVGASLNGVQDPPHEEMQDPACATPEAMLPVFRKYGDFLIGIKLRVHAHVTGQWRLDAIKQARETARILRGEGFRCRRMIHMGPFAKDVELADVLELLDEGDVITHVYRPENGATILDANGKVQSCAKEARARGVIFESGCGRSHFSLKSARKAFADDFRPQIISTDQVHYTFFYRPSGWLLLKASIYLNL